MLALKGFGFVVQLMVQLESVSGLVRDTIIPLAAEYLPCCKPRGDVRFAKTVWQVMERVSQRCLVALALIFVGTGGCFALARPVKRSCGSAMFERLCSAGMLEQAPCLPPASCTCNVASAACGHDEPAAFMCVSCCPITAAMGMLPTQDCANGASSASCHILHQTCGSIEQPTAQHSGNCSAWDHPVLQDEHILARKYCDRWMSKTLKVGPTCSALPQVGNSGPHLAGTYLSCLSHLIGCCGQLAAACCHFCDSMLLSTYTCSDWDAVATTLLPAPVVAQQDAGLRKCLAFSWKLVLYLRRLL